MLDSNHVLDLATICYNEIIDVGEIVQEGVIRMAELFIFLCAFIQFYLNDPDKNVFHVSEPRGSKKKGKGKPASDDDDSDDDDAKPELRMLSGTGAEDYFNLILLLDILAVEVPSISPGIGSQPTPSPAYTQLITYPVVYHSSSARR